MNAVVRRAVRRSLCRQARSRGDSARRSRDHVAGLAGRRVAPLAASSSRGLSRRQCERLFLDRAVREAPRGWFAAKRRMIDYAARAHTPDGVVLISIFYGSTCGSRRLQRLLACRSFLLTFSPQILGVAPRTPKRLAAIARLVDRVLVIFPFEEATLPRGPGFAGGVRSGYDGVDIPRARFAPPS